MRLHLNAGNDVATGDEIMKAIKSSGGVPGVAVELSKLAAGQQSELSALKLAGISLLFNFCYEEMAYGHGRRIKWGPVNCFHGAT